MPTTLWRMETSTGLLLLALTLSGFTTAQNASAAVDHDRYRRCNWSILDANASGIFTFVVEDPPADTGTQISIPNPSWAMTVTSPGEGHYANTSLWYDRAGQDYTDDVKLGYDVCAINIDGFPLNTLELARHDKGDCYNTFSTGCIEALLTNAADAAKTYNEDTPTYNERTQSRMSAVCQTVSENLGDNNTMAFPSHYMQEFGFMAEGTYQYAAARVAEGIYAAHA